MSVHTARLPMQTRIRADGIRGGYNYAPSHLRHANESYFSLDYMLEDSIVLRIMSTLFVLFLSLPVLADHHEKGTAIKALLITGGCCHDYENQKVIIPKGISARANVTWKIAHEGGDGRDVQIDTYKQDNWAEGFDVVVHNECFGGVTDNNFIERIVAPHRDGGVAAVFIHCSAHSYRAATTDEWRKLLGVSSYRHQSHKPVKIFNMEPKHPVMIGFPRWWKTPQGELYEIKKTWPKTTPLGEAFGEDRGEYHTCIWTNQYGKARVFGTTIGHHNETVEHPVYLDVLTRGLLWSVDRLDEDGKPKPGYGPREE